MTRGKYAERAKTKQAADGATVEALGEVNRLRAEIRRLRHLEDDVEQLRLALVRARAEVEEQRQLNNARSSDRVKALLSLNEDVTSELMDWKGFAAEVTLDLRRYKDEILKAMKEELPVNAAYKRLMKRYLLLSVTLSDGERASFSSRTPQKVFNDLASPTRGAASRKASTKGLARRLDRELAAQETALAEYTEALAEAIATDEKELV